MSKPIRVFIGINLRAGRALRAVIDELGSMGKAIKPVAVENLHLTLKFLGDTELELIPQVGELMQAACEGKSAFDLQMIGLGVFPHVRRPSVVWAGMEDAGVLSRIAEELERELRSLGFPPEQRQFQPHLTIARIRRRPPEELFALLEKHASTDFGSVMVEEVKLYQSELGPNGSKYTVLVTARLS